MEDIEKKKTVYVIFSKETGNIIGRFDDAEMAEKVNKKLFYIKEIELGPNDYYLGGHKDGNVYNNLEKPFVSERDVISKAYDEIITDWPLFTQINVILDVLEANKDIKKTEEFNSLVKYLKQAKYCLKVKIDAVKNNKAFNFVSAVDLQKAYEKEKIDS